MPGQIDKVVKAYKTLSNIPALVAAKLVGDGTVVNSFWSQRNLDRNKTSKFIRTHHITNELVKVLDTNLLDTSAETLRSVSPSEKFQALIRDVDDKDGHKQYLEIWSLYNLSCSVDLTALELHGDVYTDGEFGVLQWSPDENKLLYIAEKKQPKCEPFYKRQPVSTLKQGDSSKQAEEPTPSKGEQYLFKQDWGEQLVGKKQSVIVQYDILSDTFKILEGIPEGLCPAHPMWSPDGSYIVGVAYRTTPRKLGLIYCTNRPSAIFTLDLNENYDELSAPDKAVKSPRFSLDGKTIIWLQRNSGGPHHACMQLVKRDVPLIKQKQVTPTIIVDVVNTIVTTTNGCNFYGLYNSGFPQRCWASERRLLLTTNQRNSSNSYVIDIDTGNITELQYVDGSQVILDVHNDILLVNRRNYFTQDTLAIARLLPKGNEKDTIFYNLTEPPKTELSDKYMFTYLDLKHPNSSDSIDTFSAAYVGPKTGPKKSVPLILWPHGGPHSSFTNNLSLESSLYLSSGFAILFVNFRGSVGSGQATVDFLPGKIGIADVADCILAKQEALKSYPWLDPNCIALVGGSYGGFLVTHLSGQYPDMFKAVVARNPALDFACMSDQSDIPDLCYAVAGAKYTQVGQLSETDLLLMRKGSPVQHAHKVKAPTLLQIGSKDLRVPPSQATDYYHRLKANGTKVRMNLYEDNHPLGAVNHEMDNLINTVLWLHQHMNMTLP